MTARGAPGDLSRRRRFNGIEVIGHGGIIGELIRTQSDKCRGRRRLSRPRRGREHIDIPLERRGGNTLGAAERGVISREFGIGDPISGLAMGEMALRAAYSRVEVIAIAEALLLG